MSEQATTRATGATRLHGRWLLLARSAWVLLGILILLIIAASVPFEYAYYKSICLSAACPTDTLSERLTLQGAQALQALGLSTGWYAAYTISLELVAALMYTAVATVIFWYRSDDRMGLFAAFSLLAFGSTFITSSPAAQTSALWLPATCANYLGQASFGALFFLFPDGRFVPRWTRWLVAASAIWWIVILFYPDIPLSFNGPTFLGFIASQVIAQIYRYRRVSNAIERQQTRWVVYGFAMAIIGFISAIALNALIPTDQPQQAPLGLMLANGLLTGFLLLIPLSIGMAILRSRLWNIDVIIRRTLIYGALTTALALVYVGCVVLLQALVVPLTGGSELAIVVSTLALAALFFPLRRRIQNLIDRRFYRRKYDAAQVLAQFAATARDETDLAHLTDELLRVVDTTVQPEFVGLWLAESDAKA